MADVGSRSVDVLIIGAGPGGLSTAMHLAQLDPSWPKRLLVLEKAAHPRPKLCGGGVTRLGLQALQDLQLPFPLPIPQVQVEDVRLAYGRRTVHVHGRPQFTIFHRAELDAYLAEQARLRGITLCENEPALEIELAEDGAVVTTARGSYRARVVVGADGSKGLSRRFFSRFETRSRVARLLEVLDPAEDTSPPFSERYALLDFSEAGRGLQGYAWQFPSLVEGQPNFNFGVYDARTDLKRPKADLPGILQSSLAAWECPPLSARPAGHPIHWFSAHSLFAQPGMLLVGDAAGVDPLFGEGIGPALAYGGVAAEAVRQAFADKDYSFRDYRNRVLASPVGKYLRFRSRAARLCYRLGGHSTFMHLVWLAGSLIAKATPPPPDLYRNDHGK